MTNYNNGTGGNGAQEPGGEKEKAAGTVTPFPATGKDKKLRGRLSGLVQQPRDGGDGGDAAREPLFNLPPVTKTLCFIFIVIQAVMSLLRPETAESIILHFGFMPARYAGEMPFSLYALVDPVTHMFLHGGWMHLAMNLGMFMAFGTGLERSIGARRVLILFFVTGIAGAFLHAAISDDRLVPVIGASGGISGLFGAMMMMVYTRGLLGAGYAKLVLLTVIWVVVSLFFGRFGIPGESNSVAWATHVGGFVVGLAIYKPVLQLDV
jgi:membrane associated rhomboid family serine protease